MPQNKKKIAELAQEEAERIEAETPVTVNYAETLPVEDYSAQGRFQDAGLNIVAPQAEAILAESAGPATPAESAESAEPTLNFDTDPPALTPKTRKATLVAYAHHVGAKVTPDSMTSAQIIESINKALKKKKK